MNHASARRRSGSASGAPGRSPCVRRFLADYEPLGARVAVDRPERTAVGVLRDMEDLDLDMSARPTAFIPRSQASDGMTRGMNRWFSAAFAVRTVRTDNPATFVAVALVLGGAALLASWIPARRAARVDPMVALRAD